MRLDHYLLCALLLACVGPALAEQVIRSGPERVHLVEVYTSEGCSSCPPADRWLSGMLGREALWSGFVPVAFHVDYWNHIGWSDRFSSPRYSQRQRDYTRRGRARAVYTPGFMVNGLEWRGFFDGHSLPEPSGEQVGVLALHIGANHSLRVHYQAEAAAALPDALLLHLTLLGFDLETGVTAGENRGRTLKHDFAVLAWQAEDLHGQAGAYTATTQLPRSQHEAPRKALAAWLSLPGDPAPIQVAGGMLEQ